MRLPNKFRFDLRSQEGFTLVELLIVIVIIGILAGVVIGVLNPIQQQNRARDGVTRAQIDKMALSAKSLFVSSPRSTNRSPTQAEFAAGVGTIVAGNNCTDNTPDYSGGECTFAISGQSLAATCNANGYTGSGGSTQCEYAYWRDGNSFRVAARGAANPVVLFLYNYEETVAGTINEGFYACDMSASIADTPVGSSSCSAL